MATTVAPPSKFFALLGDMDVVHLLAFVGGFVDTAGYLRLLGVFTSSITGNLVVATASVASLRGVVCRSSVCVVFFVSGGVAAAMSLHLRLAHGVSQRAVCVLLFGLEIALIIASWILGIYYDSMLLSNTNIDNPINVLIGCLLGASMGFHNVSAKEAIANCPPTTVMTSTMINVAQNLTNTIGYGLAKHSLLRLQPRAEGSAPCVPCCALSQTPEQEKALSAKYTDSLTKFLSSGKPLLAFIVGCIIGAATVDKGSWHCLAIPVAALCLIIGDILLQLWRIARPQPRPQYAEIESPKEEPGAKEGKKGKESEGKEGSGEAGAAVAVAVAVSAKTAAVELTAVSPPDVSASGSRV